MVNKSKWIELKKFSSKKLKTNTLGITYGWILISWNLGNSSKQLKIVNPKKIWIKSLLTFFTIKMMVKELIKQLKMVQKNHEGKEIQVKIGTIEKGEVKEKDLILQNIVESNYDGKTTIILTNY